MNNQTNTQKFKALAARLRFIQKRIYGMSEGDEKDEIYSNFNILTELIKNYYGPKISNEIFWTTKEK